MGTRKISQLETISDANLSGEAILPVVVSDPLIPNRKAKVNQLFRGVAQGTKTAPGLSFDLDRNTGLFQNAYDQLGLSFGVGALYLSRIVNSGTSSSLYITAQDESTTSADIVLSPKGSGSVRVAGTFTISDNDFVLEDSQGPRARFEVSNVGTGTNTRIFTLPAITSGNGTTLVGDDTSQTLRNKTILISEDNFVLVDGDEEAIFQINWPFSSDTRRSYFLPDAGAVTTPSEPTATASTLLDTKAEQTALSKTFVNVKFVSNAEDDTPVAQLNTDALTVNRVVTVPDQSLTLLGTDTTQSVTNKTFINAIFADNTDVSKRLQFNLANQNTTTLNQIEFPATSLLNNGNANNTLVTELATQTLSSKTLVRPKFKEASGTNSVTIDTSNLTGTRIIRFPDSDATLLSTDNVTVDDVSFGAGIGGANLTSRTRLQQFFYAGF